MVRGRGTKWGRTTLNAEQTRPPIDESETDRLLDQWNPNSPGTSADSLAWPLSTGLPTGLGDATMDWSPLPMPSGEETGEVDFVLASEPVNPADTRVLAETQTHGAKEKPIVFPRQGEGIGGFRIISELGRGAFARVYLAHEISLGNRPVALKVSRAEGDEPRVLARLQHTHIVPIYSVLDDQQTGLRLICMPYFGGANLAQVLDAAGPGRTGTTRALSLIDALDLVGRPSPTRQASRTASRRSAQPSRETPDGMSGVGSRSVRIYAIRRALFGPESREGSRSDGDAPVIDPETGQPARQFLRGSSFVRASAWVVARLAEGLEHAHSRGLLHRDLKPSNILIAADGTPMLLDFNLATEAAESTAEDGARALIGGTLPYMAPEHLDAFNPRGLTPNSAVDERSDLYALGLILFEMVAGCPAFPEPPEGLALPDLLAWLTTERRRSSPSLRAADSRTPWSLDAIVARCLDPDPEERYQSAGELAEDLRRFLDDRPLKFTPEPSLYERLGKWSRRHPRASSAWTLGPLALVLTLTIATIAWKKSAQLGDVAARLNLRRFHQEFHECQFLLNTSSGGELTEHLRRGIQRSKAAIDRFGVDDRGDWLRSFWVTSLAPEERATLRSDIAELIELEARARVVLAVVEGTEDDRRRALERAVGWLDRAEALDPSPSPALYADRARYQQALGRADLARLDLAKRDSTAPASCRDEYLLGTADLAAGHPDRAERRLVRAVGLDPSRFWAWFALGLCHFDQGRFSDAVGDFNVCSVLMPGFAWPPANRGLALARAGRLPEAIESFDRALALSPNFADALAGRGLALLATGEPGRADADLGRAIELGRRDDAVRAGRAEALAKLGRLDESFSLYGHLIASRPADAALIAARGMARLSTDPAGAGKDFRAALTIDPKLAIAHHGLARLTFREDPTAALTHADHALDADPRFLDALELRSLIRARLGRVDAADDVDRLIRAPNPGRLYNGACALAVLSANHPSFEPRALELLRRAIDAGFPAEKAQVDTDFKALRTRADFRKLVGLDQAP
jgi:eukaryotic-like serine/threonine-protein kinase